MNYKLQRLFLLSLVLLSGIMTSWAQTETPYSPTLEVNFRTAAGNTAWNSGYPKSAADEGNTTFEVNYFAGLFALQKYTIPNLQDVTKLVLTLYAGSGTDAIRVWSFPNNSWTAASSVDDMVNWATQTVGFAPRATEGTANTPLVSKGTWGSSELSPRPATFTISGTALATLKANASTDGTFTLMFTDGALTSNSSRRYLSTNSANAEASRPVLVATATDPAPKTAKIGDTEYETLADAWAAAVAADADTEIEVSGDQKLTARLTWNKAHTLTITPTADVTIKGAPGMMWFLVNTSNGVFNIGSTDHKITLDGEGKTMTVDGAVIQRENGGMLNVTNVEFKDFDLGETARLIGDKQQGGVMTIQDITITNCTNPKGGYIYSLRVANDALVMKGYVNIDDASTGTAIYKQANLKTDGSTEGRMKVDDANFTASKVLTIDWVGLDNKDVFVAGQSVVVGVTSAAIANCFKLAGDIDWTLTRVNNDLKLTAPVEPTAQIGTTGYADLAAALTAVQDGETITLLADQEVSSRINVKNMSITIDGQGQYAIRRATTYTNGLVLLTQKADEGYATAVTLQDVVLDGSAVETSAAFIEASNGGATVLNGVTVQNVTTTADAAIINKGGGRLTLNGVTFTNCTAAKADVFEGTSVTLAGSNTIGSIYVEKQLTLKAEGATATSPVVLKTDAQRAFGLLVEGGDASQFASETFRLSQQMDGVYAMPLAVAGSFAHPGLLHTAADITRVKGALDVEPFKSAYGRLEAQSGGSAAGAVEYLKRMDQGNWGSTYSDYSNFTHAATDAKLAYELALRYQLKGSTAAANAAVNILNNWATTNKGFLRLKGYNNNIPDPNEYLMCIQAYQFANAAELLRDYMGSSDFDRFRTWIRQTFADVAILFLENHHGDENATHYWANWDLAALTAMFSVGVLCDDAALTDYALNYATSGSGMGSASGIITATHNDPDSDETLAQCQESGRDQGHATLDVTLLGALCQMAQNQGTDLFTPYKALEMAEYVGKYNLKNDAGSFSYAESAVPFTAYDNGEYSHGSISADGRGTVRPSWELFYAYARSNDRQARYCQQWSEWARRQNAYGEAESASTDELGFGTLMYASADDTAEDFTLAVTDAGAATMVLPFDALIPTGVEVYTLTYTAGQASVLATAVTGTVEANTPVLVVAGEGNYHFAGTSVWKGSATTTAGALTGVYSKTVVPAGSYILTRKDGTLAFRKVDGATNYVEANHAYLTAATADAPMLDISFGGATSVTLVKGEEGMVNDLYDLQGRRVDGSVKKGVRIVNGKKVMVR